MLYFIKRQIESLYRRLITEPSVRAYTASYTDREINQKLRAYFVVKELEDNREALEEAFKQ